MAKFISYEQLKTPYFKLEVFSPDGKRNVILPHHINRLVESIKITETYQQDSSGKSDFNAVEIIFVEGSREPASTSAKTSTKGLYQVANEGKGVAMRIPGSITNRNGAITDLRFSGKNGITFITEKELKQGRVDRTPIKKVEGKTVTRSFPDEDDTPLFLFAAYNQIKITWGYLEGAADTHSGHRTIRFRIKAMSSNFTDSGGVKTTITGFDGGDDANGTVAPKSVSITPKTPSGHSYVYQDPPTPELLRQLATILGMEPIISDFLPATTLQQDYKKSWIAGESLWDFISRYAKRHNCKAKLLLDPATGKDILVFMSSDDFDGKTITTDKGLFNYKAPGSILKSVDVTLIFNNLHDIKKVAINAQGEKVSTNTEDPQEEAKIFEGEKFRQNKRTTVPWIEAAEKDIFGERTATYVEVTPEDNQDTVAELAKKDVDIRAGDSASLSFTTLGFTRLTPGLVEFNGLGVRFNGFYRVQTVEHNISVSGYTCKGFAISAFDSSGGGVDVIDAKKSKPKEKALTRLFLEQKMQLPKEEDAIPFKRPVEDKKETAGKTFNGRRPLSEKQGGFRNPNYPERYE